LAAAAPGPSPGRATFEAFAGFYDDFTAGYQASAWTLKLEKLVIAHGLPGRTLLDVGCGTGKSFLPMVERGWQALGCDVAPAMLEVARRKADAEVRLEVADARELPLFGAFDLVWALNDTLNYLLSEEELEAALVGMRRNLAEGGVLLFDLLTLTTFRASYSSRGSREVGRREMTWSGLETEPTEPGSICEARLEVAGDPASSHVHRERHFPEARVLVLLERAGLECLEVWGDYEGEQDRPLDEGRHQRAIYIAR
jgi:SAM-dependent methyltransferase